MEIHLHLATKCRLTSCNRLAGSQCLARLDSVQAFVIHSLNCMSLVLQVEFAAGDAADCGCRDQLPQVDAAHECRGCSAQSRGGIPPRRISHAGAAFEHWPPYDLACSATHMKLITIRG